MLAGLEVSEAEIVPGAYSGSVRIHHYRIEKREISYATNARLSARLELAAGGRSHFTLSGRTEKTYHASKYAPRGESRSEQRENFDLSLSGTLGASGELPLHDAEHRMVLQLRCQSAHFQGKPVLACALEHAPNGLFALGVDDDEGWLLVATGEGIEVSSDRDQHDSEPHLTLGKGGLLGPRP